MKHAPAAGRADAFAALRTIFAPYVSRLHVTADDDRTFMLDGAFEQTMRRPMFFGGVRRGRNYVSFYLMPVYTHPELLGRISDALRAHLHGKSCFNFTAPDAALLEELRRLTSTAFEHYVKLGYVE